MHCPPNFKVQELTKFIGDDNRTCEHVNQINEQLGICGDFDHIKIIMFQHYHT